MFALKKKGYPGSPGVQRIRGQLAYMNIENFKLHCSLFLALKNMDKISVLSVANIVLYV